MKKLYGQKKIALIGCYKSIRQSISVFASNLLFRTLGSISILLFPLTGCAVNQEQEVATYRDVLGCESQDSSLLLEVNEPLTLRHALHLANCHNEHLSIKGEEYLQSLIDNDRATARLLPKVAFLPTYTRQQKAHFPASSSLAAEFVRPETTDMPLTAQMDLNIQDIANVKRTQATAQQQRSLLLDLKDSVLLDVAKVYYQILISELQADVLEYSFSVQQERVRNIENQY